MMAEKREQPTGPPEIELEDFAPPEEEEDDIHYAIFTKEWIKNNPKPVLLDNVR